MPAERVRNEVINTLLYIYNAHVQETEKIQRN